MSALDVITRGVDSSGRVIKQTRQAFQFYDRVNEHIGGMLVIVQGGWSFADASANTHGQGMCTDFRRWNLSDAQTHDAVFYGRDLMGTMWERTEADGFDPHIHNNLIGDRPATSAALAQIPMYKAGLNGLANRAPDRVPYRPNKIHDYIYLPEDDMFEDADRQLLKQIDKKLDAEKTRDQAERERDKARFSRLIAVMGNQADDIGKLIDTTTDAATKQQLKRMKEKILKQLKDDPDVDGVDNPSDDAMGRMNMG